MSWDRAAIDAELTRILAFVFGVDEDEIEPDTTFAGDLVAESLDYVDIELHVSGRFGIDFRFADHVDALRAAAGGPVRVRDLADRLETLLTDG
jgi:acyl carrier protein